MFEWLKYLIIIRRSNESNVILLVTDDMFRLNHIRKFILSENVKRLGFRKIHKSSGGVEKIDKDVNPTIYEVDIEISSIYRYDGKAQSEVRKPLKDLYREAQSTPVLILMHWFYRRQEAQQYENFLLSFAINDRIFVHRSTVLVITSSELLFNDNLLDLVGIVKIKATDKEKEEIINRVSQRYRLPKPNIQLFRGLNLHETQTVMLKKASLGDMVSYEQLVTELKKKKFEKLGTKLDFPQMGLERIGGYDAIKEWVRDNIIYIIKELDDFVKLGIGMPKGVLFIGPPGTGKTVFSKAIAGELRIPFVEVQSSTLFSRYVGESEARVARLIDLANEIGPAILFVDEAEQLFQSRERIVSTDSGVTQRVTAMLLSGLGREDRNFTLIMTANYVNLLDRALLRRGRIDAIIPILYPDQRAREEILKVHTKIIRKIPLARDFSYKKIAQLTPWWTGSELAELIVDSVKKMKRQGQDKLTMDIVLEKIRKARINPEERRRIAETYINELREIADAPIIEELYQEQLELLRNEPEEIDYRLEL